MGARLSVLINVFTRNGLIEPRHLPLALLMILSALGRLPVQPIERLKLARLARAASPMEAPVFVIGHWRSGTTHLHNLLARSAAFGHISPLASGLPDEILTLGTWFRPLLERALPEDRHVDRVAVTPDSPQEDEIPLANLQPLSVFHAVYSPKHFQRLFDRAVFFEGCSAEEIERWTGAVKSFAEKISLHQGGRRLLIKNPVYTARLTRLLEIWPEARFIHVRRNPYEVFVSTRHYYRTLLADLAMQPFDHIDLDAFVLATFKRLMDAYDQQCRALPPGTLTEVSYERLRREPLLVLTDIHEIMGLPGWADTEQRVRAYLETVADYRANSYRITDTDRSAVDRAWKPYIKAWEAMAR